MAVPSVMVSLPACAYIDRAGPRHRTHMFGPLLMGKISQMELQKPAVTVPETDWLHGATGASRALEGREVRGS